MSIDSTKNVLISSFCSTNQLLNPRLKISRGKYSSPLSLYLSFLSRSELLVKLYIARKSLQTDQCNVARRPGIFMAQLMPLQSGIIVVNLSCRTLASPADIVSFCR